MKDDKNTYKKIIIAEIRATINIKMCTEEWKEDCIKIKERKVKIKNRRESAKQF